MTVVEKHKKRKSKIITAENLEKFNGSGIDLPTRTIILSDSVDEHMLDRTLRAVHYFSQGPAPAPINVYLSSHGGEVVSGLGIYDALTKCPSYVTITVFGSAESMAAIILQAADCRRITENSYLMLHWGDDHPPEGSKRNIDAHIRNTRWLDKRCDTILLERIKVNRPKYTIEELREDTQFDKYLPPQEALNWGLVDDII